MEAVVAHTDLESVVGLSRLSRRGLVPYYESVGFEFSEPEIDVPEELVRMVFVRCG